VIRAPPGHAAMDRDPRDDEAAPAPAPGPLRVLVVDDNADAADALAAYLELEGCEARVANDAMQALEGFAAFMPHVAVLDIGLPEMDGYELAARIRASDAGRGCRLIAVTGYGLADDRARAQAAGFETHLVKPVDLDVLLRAVRPEAAPPAADAPA
jgi:CheY-like chemotaxis protein